MAKKYKLPEEMELLKKKFNRYSTQLFQHIQAPLLKRIFFSPRKEPMQVGSYHRTIYVISYW